MANDKKKTSTSKKASLVIMINIPDLNTRRGEGTAAIQKGDLGHVMQFQFSGLTLKSDLAQAVQQALAHLTEVELTPPPRIDMVEAATTTPPAHEAEDDDDETETESSAEADEETVDPDEEHGTGEVVATNAGTASDAVAAVGEGSAGDSPVSEEVAMPPISSFCGSCGETHLAILAVSGIQFALQADPSAVREKCPACGELLIETSIALDAVVARQQFPLETIYEGQELAAMKNNQVKRDAAAHAQAPDETLNTLYLHQLPIAQANLYLHQYQIALAEAAQPDMPPNTHQPVQAQTVTAPVANQPTANAQMSLF